jgi:hypothetical protein
VARSRAQIFDQAEKQAITLLKKHEKSPKNFLHEDAVRNAISTLPATTPIGRGLAQYWTRLTSADFRNRLKQKPPPANPFAHGVTPSLAEVVVWDKEWRAIKVAEILRGGPPALSFELARQPWLAITQPFRATLMVCHADATLMRLEEVAGAILAGATIVRRRLSWVLERPWQSNYEREAWTAIAKEDLGA